MESAEVKSTGDTTFLLEQHTPDPTPIEEKQAPMNASNPIEKAKSQITAPSSTPDPTPSRPTATTDTTSMTATPGPIKTTTNVYPAESDSQPSTQPSDRTPTASAPIKTTTNVYPSESISQPPTSQSTQSTQSTQSRTAASGKRDTRNSNAASSATAGNTKSNMQSSNTAPLPLADSSEYAPSTTTSFIDKHDVVCPDPTAHRDTRLQEQASTAALYVTKTGKNSKQRDDVLDSNNKLSSRSKY